MSGGESTTRNANRNGFPIDDSDACGSERCLQSALNACQEIARSAEVEPNADRTLKTLCVQLEQLGFSSVAWPLSTVRVAR